MASILFFISSETYSFFICSFVSIQQRMSSKTIDSFFKDFDIMFEDNVE